MESSSGLAPMWEACAREGKPCVGWVERYFKDCLCGFRDDVSFALGLVSLCLWGVAEIPQLVTNFKNKSAHGVSLGLLLTWVVGDVFNLAGCLLEPATLPTQLYTAWLYTVITVVLVLQTLYYDYFRKWRKHRGLEIDQEDCKDKKTRSSWNPEPCTPPAMPVPTATTFRRDMYYTSARSLASSGTPPFGSSTSYLRAAGGVHVVKSGPSAAAAPMLHDSSSDDEGSHPPARLPPRPRAASTASRSLGYGTFLAAAANLPSLGRGLMETHTLLIGRKLLQEKETTSTNPYGVWLGWAMAAIYMGGRLPQIFLNIKRGSVEGLNPLMFLFALLANATYVGSILARSVQWARIRANAPWLLDAIACVLLDLFILTQYAYYKLRHSRTTTKTYADCPEAEKPLLG